MSTLRTRALAVPPWLYALVPGLAWMWFAPATPDLAAAEYRVDLYDHIGVRLWDNFWYSGHHLPAYSVLYPPLASLLGERFLGVVCAVISTLLFQRLATARFGARAAVGVRLFAVGSVAGLCIGQLTFSLGLCFALASLLAWQRGRLAGAVALAAASALASPVAAAFLALAACAVIVGRGRTFDATARAAVLVGGAAFAVVVALAVAFPEGGRQPFALQSLLPLLGASLVIAVAFWSTEPVIRAGALIYGLAALAAFVLDTPMGSNANRLGAAFALGLLACAPSRRSRVVLVACLALFAWQWTGPARDMWKGSHDASAHGRYYAPLRTYFDNAGAAGPAGARTGRLEIPFTRLHWESRYMAEDMPLARGWERQLDTKYNAIFYDGPLTAGTYHDWLRTNGVLWVALPDARLDPAGRPEAALIRGGLPYLREVWSNRHWRLYKVTDPLALTSAGAVVTDFGHNHIDGYARRAGWFGLRVRYTPYFSARGVVTCARETPGGWTRLYARKAGQFHLRAKFSVRAALTRKARCTL